MYNNNLKRTCNNETIIVRVNKKAKVIIIMNIICIQIKVDNTLSIY